MSDIIQILPDHIANQIAAGEVVQRPASAVKELVENAIDAGATHIQLIIKDAGRTLIQVIDNGCGMSTTDARLCFERHATSKIRQANDLFTIRTMGFRGEALASIAAVAQVELKTKRDTDEVGTCINIEGSEIKDQQQCACQTGTSIAVKNLFFNVPARRNFLKTNSVEFKHIEEEFFRTALIHTNISFTFYNNDKLIYQLQSCNFHQRITALFGNNYKERLHPVEESTKEVKIKGYICKPEFAKKTRGEQYMFVNNRFCKSFYFNNAIEKAFSDLLPEKTYPSYFINLEIDPALIDVNIHPTKTEVKFIDEVIIYAVLRSAVKKTLGQYSLSTEIEFNTIEGLDLNPAPAPRGYIAPEPTVKVNTNYNPFSSNNTPSYREPKSNRQWENFFDISNETIEAPKQETLFEAETNTEEPNIEISTSSVVQVFNQYIVSNLGSGLLIIDQQRAHERILYEYYMGQTDKEIVSQQLMFPVQCSFSTADAEIIVEISNVLEEMGFRLNRLGNTVFVVTATPTDMNDDEIQTKLNEIVDDYKNSLMQKFNDKQQSVAMSIAKRLAVKNGKKLKQEEMQNIIAQLFSCRLPNVSPFGKKTMTIMKENELSEKFK